MIRLSRITEACFSGSGTDSAVPSRRHPRSHKLNSSYHRHITDNHRLISLTSILIVLCSQLTLIRAQNNKHDTDMTAALGVVGTVGGAVAGGLSPLSAVVSPNSGGQQYQSTDNKQMGSHESSPHQDTDDMDQSRTSRDSGCSILQVFKGRCSPDDQNTKEQSNDGNVVRTPTRKRDQNCDYKDQCTPNPATGVCVWYEPQTQASSLVQAALNFVDLTARPPVPLVKPADHKCGKCVTDECRACVQGLLNHIHDTTDWITSTQLTRALKDANADASVKVSCPGLTESKNSYTRPSESNGSIQYIKMCLRSAERVLQATRARTRTKRDDTNIRISQPPNGSGERALIKCVDKGIPSEEQAEYVSLCSQCWVLRQMPDQFFPRYINELICKPDPTLLAGEQPTCFGGYGLCQAADRPVQLQRTLDTRTNVTVAESVAVGACCDCMMPLSSPIVPFIQV